MFAVIVATFARRFKRDRRLCSRGRTAKERNRGNDECCRPRHCARLYHFAIAVCRAKEAQSHRVKYWEIIGDNLSEAGWGWGFVSGVDSNGQTMFTVDAHRDGKHFVVRADEKLAAFVELEAAVLSIMLVDE